MIAPLGKFAAANLPQVRPGVALGGEAVGEGTIRPQGPFPHTPILLPLFSVVPRERESGRDERKQVLRTWVRDDGLPGRSWGDRESPLVSANSDPCGVAESNVTRGSHCWASREWHQVARGA
jgi:hypothetical protein